MADSFGKFYLGKPYDHLFFTKIRKIFVVKVAKYFMPQLAGFISMNEKSRGV